MNDRLVNKLDKSLSKINDIEAEYLFTIAVPATTTTTATAAMSKCQCQKWIYIVHSLRKTSNALNTLVLWKSLQWLSVTVHSTLRILHVFRQWVPDRRTSNRKSPTAVRAEPVAWNGDLMAAGWTHALAENSVRNWCAVVGQIQRSLVVLASVHEQQQLHRQLLLLLWLLVEKFNIGSSLSRVAQQTASKHWSVSYKTPCSDVESCDGWTGCRKRDVRLRISGSGDRSSDRGRQKTRLHERSWERTSFNGMCFFCCSSDELATAESWNFVDLYSDVLIDTTF